ncbi:unnamed protein product, partial [Somion occarium]
SVVQYDLEIQESEDTCSFCDSKAPNAYRCAAPGCGIEGTKKSALLKCAGKCPPDVKPSYCSKECQKAHWKTHRSICNPNAKPKAKAEEQASSDTNQTQVASTSAQQSPRTIGDDIRTDGREHIIEWAAPHLLDSAAIGYTVSAWPSSVSPASASCAASSSSLSERPTYSNCRRTVGRDFSCDRTISSHSGADLLPLTDMCLNVTVSRASQWRESLQKWPGLV